jgi:hypothetical protein
LSTDSREHSATAEDQNACNAGDAGDSHRDRIWRFDLVADLKLCTSWDFASPAKRARKTSRARFFSCSRTHRTCHSEERKRRGTCCSPAQREKQVPPLRRRFRSGSGRNDRVAWGCCDHWLRSLNTVHRLRRSTDVAVSNRVPACAKEPIFGLSQPHDCSYIKKAQRFLTTTDLN